MLILAVDTSGAQGSLALAHWDQSFKWRRQTAWTKKAMHSELATVELQKLLKESDSDLKDLTYLAVNIGPGSFTGLRVGLSLVKTLAYSLALPVFAVNSLELLAQTKARPGENVFIAIKAVQDQYYAAAYGIGTDGLANPLLEPRSLAESELSPMAATCNSVWIEGRTAGFTPHTEAKDLLDVLSHASFKRPISDWKTVEPLYVRGSEAEEKLKKGLLRPL